MSASKLQGIAGKFPLILFIPENPRFLRYNLEMKKAISEVIRFLSSLQQQDGGFAKNLSETRSETWATGQAVLMLCQLHALEHIDTYACKRWLLERFMSEGGFEWMAGVGKTTIENTVYGMYCLEIFDCLSPSIAADIQNYILDLEKDGGFKAKFDERGPDIRSTFDAVMGLKLLNALNETNLEQLGQFLASCQQINGGFEQYPGEGDISVATTAIALLTAKNTGNLSRINVPSAIDFILKHQLADGGFPYRLNEAESQTWATGYVVHGLDAVDALQKIGVDRLVSLILSRQLDNGGMVFRPQQDVSHTNISPTFIGFTALFKLLPSLKASSIADANDTTFELLDIFHKHRRISIEEASKICGCSPFEVRRAFEKLLLYSWISGEIRDGVMITYKTEKQENIREEMLKLETMFNECVEKINRLEQQILQLRSLALMNENYSENDAKKIIREIKSLLQKLSALDNEVKIPSSAFKLIATENKQRLLSDIWSKKKAQMLQDLEKIWFTMSWKTR
ncbi:MAG: prenyltransferase/squalene oxidase repeat-containing protein [Candidatus Ranarchaeia archaeon]